MNGPVVVALGSNLGQSPDLIRQALAALRELSARGFANSSLWETAPVDCPPGSANFVNAVAMWTPRERETPESLLVRLQALEVQFGRTPKRIHNEARPLDLDLIAFGNETRATTALTLPHPRAHLRRFVLQPLNEIAPQLLLPGQTRTVGELLAELPEDSTMRKVP